MRWYNQSLKRISFPRTIWIHMATPDWSGIAMWIHMKQVESWMMWSTTSFKSQPASKKAPSPPITNGFNKYRVCLILFGQYLVLISKTYQCLDQGLIKMTTHHPPSPPVGFNNCLHLCVEETERQSDHKTVAEEGGSKYFDKTKTKYRQRYRYEIEKQSNQERKEPTEESKTYTISFLQM